MPEELTSLYVYGVIEAEEKPKWTGTGINNEQVFIISEGKMGALVHRCKAEPYIPKYAKEAQELVIAHNNVLEKAAKGFGGVLPFSFDTIIQEKEGRSAEENLKNWLKEEAKRIEQSWERIRGMNEYGIRIFYDRKRWVEGIRLQNKNISKKGDGINYLLKRKQDYEAKDMVINKIKERRQEIFDKIKAKVKEAKIVESDIKLMEEKRDALMNISLLATEQQFKEVEQFLQENISKEDYRCAGPFPPYSFVSK